ncbi:uncharacterized protein BX664DRAFT_331296 [Halteromyces radiatus]|uniref:uncharacterized protein n=1 Tax=Halteromyces radiatus TaxID=101107 RepID=UPI002220D83F|nr:uncharacterized protein BX664DRAFT_331296 [Halteromyces radiatus]KAI8088757.1 hypothetical protein BX664DRAFT_331296 [Halteromyces radiatus]
METPPSHEKSRSPPRYTLSTKTTPTTTTTTATTPAILSPSRTRIQQQQQEESTITCQPTNSSSSQCSSSKKRPLPKETSSSKNNTKNDFSIEKTTNNTTTTTQSVPPASPTIITTQPTQSPLSSPTTTTVISTTSSPLSSTSPRPSAPSYDISQVTHDAANYMFKVCLDSKGNIAALCYLPTRFPTLVEFYHTEIPFAYRHLGIGDLLVKRAFQWVEQSNMLVIPSCPFVVRYLKTHYPNGTSGDWKFIMTDEQTGLKKKTTS